MGIFDFLVGKPDRDRFAKLMLDTLRREGISLTFRYDRERFRLVDGAGEGGHVFFLDNAYADYCKAARRDRDQVLSKYAQSARRNELPPDFAQARASILPAIRHRADETMLGIMLAAEGREGPPGQATTPLVADLTVSLVHDTEHSMARLTLDQLAGWGVTMEQALAVALDNLRDRSADRFEALAPGTWVAAWRDYYDPSRILLQDVIRRRSVRGDPVVLAPTPHHLLVTGADDAEGLEMLARLGGDLLEKETKRLSGSALRLVGDCWEPFDPEGRACTALADLRRRFLLEDYGGQKQALEQLHGKTGEDVFVASYLLYRQQDASELFSAAVWTRDVVTLLPVADRITFVIPEPQEAVTVRWSDGVRIAGDLMAPLGLWPERFRVDRFPTEAALQELRAVAIR